MTYVPGTWHDHRRLYAGSETTWRKSLEQRADDGRDVVCGWCGEPYKAHDPFVPVGERLVAVPTADAVLLRPVPQVDVDRMLGRLTGPQYTQALIAAAERAMAALTPDDPALPQEVAR